MRNLPVPTTLNITKLRNIIKSKNRPYKGRLERIRATVKKRYDEYDAHSDQLENLTRSHISGVNADALIKCYTSRTTEMSSLRDELLYPDLEDFDACPFCGIGEPTTLDHYLPKEDFPEFSVLAKNLIPICGVCNSNYKGTKWIENNQRLFIHTYYDIFPDKYFFNALITINRKLTIDFQPITVAEEPYFSTLFNNHFKKLSLTKRYRVRAASEISRKRRSLERILINGGTYIDVARSLENEASELEIEYSKNHWKPVLYKALSSSVDFCNGGFRKQVMK